MAHLQAIAQEKSPAVIILIPSYVSRHIISFR